MICKKCKKSTQAGCRERCCSCCGVETSERTRERQTYEEMRDLQEIHEQDIITGWRV